MFKYDSEGNLTVNIKLARDMILSSIKKDKCLTKRVLKEVLLETNREDIRNIIHLFREVDGEMGL